MKRPHSNRGSVLVIVMVTLLFAAAALMLFIERASSDLLVEARDADARRLRMEAYSALEVTLAVLGEFQQVNGALNSPAQGWADPIGLSGWAPSEGRTVEVSFADESGKYPLSGVEALMLVNLFKTWELSQHDAEKLADSLLGWMRKDHVATGAFAPSYENSTLPYAAPARALRSFSELAAIDFARDLFYGEDGAPNELWHRFAATFSLFNFGKPNLNAIDPALLHALGQLDMTQQSNLADYLAGKGSYAFQGPGFFATMPDARKVLGLAGEGLDTKIQALRILVTVREGSSVFRLSAVVAPPDGAKLVEPMPTPVVAGATVAKPEPAARGAAVAGTAAEKIKYPFKLLEIKENDEIPSGVPTQPENA